MKEESNKQGKKTALITGAAGGMGSAAAKQLIAQGYMVFGLDISPMPSGDGFCFIRTDFTDPASVEQAFHTICSMTDGIDCIIHLAGIYQLHSLIEIAEEDFENIFRINLTGVYRVNKYFLPLLRRGGRILITTSELAPLDPLPFTGIYAITKAALDKYAYSLRMELQLLGYRVIVLRPGAVNTRLLDASVRSLSAFCAETRLYPGNSEKFRRITERIEARNVPPEKIAVLIAKALAARNPKLVYKINRNPLLLLMNALPDRLQIFLIRRLLK